MDPTLPSASTCPQCGSSLAAPASLCPRCLLNVAAVPTEAETLPFSSNNDWPDLTEVAAAFPDLEILDVIGRGGMSVVYRARQPRLDRIVALKILPKSLAAAPGFVERFSREGRVLARLKHPSIVTVHDFGQSAGFCFLLMEYVDGVNLRQAMRAGRLSPEQALAVVPGLCEALQFAHGEGVLHRDIKPENILLDSRGRVKIADFGIAKIVGDNSGSTLLTQAGTKLGTAHYMAPEQIEEPASVDHRADIYSLGVVLYEMLTGELPLGRFPAPSERAAVSTLIDEVVFRALAKERELRQQSAGEVKTQIEQSSGQPAAVAARPAVAIPRDSFDYKSKRVLFGMPLLHVTAGTDPATGRRRVARGFFAFGDIAIGVFAFGGYARGLFACGGMAVGVVAIGGVGLGLVSWCGLALALALAFGGAAIAPLATGGAAVGWTAVGGFALGWDAFGGYVIAQNGAGGLVRAAHVFREAAEMSPPLRWLYSLSPWTSLGSFIWIPLMLPSILVPVWARRRLEQQNAPANAQPPAEADASRLLWLIPAAFGLAFLGWLLLFLWTRGSGAGASHALAPAVMTFLGMLELCLAVPLTLRLVPMNGLYGFPVPAAFASRERWFDINAYAGSQFAGWAMVPIGAGLAGFFVMPRYGGAYVPSAVGVSLLAVVLPLIQTLWWVRKLPAPGQPPRRRWHDFLSGKVIAGVALAFFIKSFIAETYTVAGGGVAPEVPVGSRLLAWKLVSRFAPGDIVTYDDNGRTYLGRISRSEGGRVWITRNGQPEHEIAAGHVTGRLLLQLRPPSGS